MRGRATSLVKHARTHFVALCVHTRSLQRRRGWGAGGNDEIINTVLSTTSSAVSITQKQIRRKDDKVASSDKTVGFTCDARNVFIIHVSVRLASKRASDSEHMAAVSSRHTLTHIGGARPACGQRVPSSTPNQRPRSRPRPRQRPELLSGVHSSRTETPPSEPSPSTEIRCTPITEPVIISRRGGECRERGGCRNVENDARHFDTYRGFILLARDSITVRCC